MHKPLLDLRRFSRCSKRAFRWPRTTRPSLLPKPALAIVMRTPALLRLPSRSLRLSCRPRRTSAVVSMSWLAMMPIRPFQGTIETLSVDGLRDTLDRLVIFPFEIARAAVPHLRNQAKARVVFISSNRNRLPVRGGSIPDIARAAVNALVISLSIELAPHGIPVNAIAPNYLYSETYYPRSRFVDDAAGRAYIAQVVPAGRLGQPEEIGELIRYLATMDGAFLTGAVIDFSGGWPVATPFPQ